MGALDDLLATGGRNVWEPDDDTLAKIAEARRLNIEWDEIVSAVSEEAGFLVSETTIRRRLDQWRQRQR